MTKEFNTLSPAFEYRACYVNGAEHLQNAWNVNFLYPNATGMWSDEEWKAFLIQIKAFGYNCFEFWIPPTLAVIGQERKNAAMSAKKVMNIVHNLGLKFKVLLSVNSIGAEWYYACPNDEKDRKTIFEFWNFWSMELSGADIFGIFPGDPGGCNRNGCTHKTFIDLSIDLTKLIKRNSPFSHTEIGTWGTPFTGWGDDMRHVPDWDGSIKMLSDSRYDTLETPFYIWNRKSQQVDACMKYLLMKLDQFPEDTVIAINLGFNPDADPLSDYDARKWAYEIAKKRQIVTWDYSVSEGELINYPHWRLPKIQEKRKLELESAPYSGGMIYTMSPKLNILTLYVGGQLFINPNKSVDELAFEFAELVFGDGKIGLLMECFEIVNGWGHYPRRSFSRDELQNGFNELISRLEKCKGNECRLPIFPDVQTYRQDLLWHAKQFKELTSESPDRNRIREEYWKKALSIYDAIPMSADQRAHHAADGYSKIGLKL